MALIRCIECGKEISEMAENCPHCGYKNQRIEEDQEIPKEVKLGARKYEIALYACYATIVVLAFLMMFGAYAYNEAVICIVMFSFVITGVLIILIKKKKRTVLGIWNDQYEAEAKERNKIFANVCPSCGSNDINISINTVGETYKGKSEVRKKSAVTRGANKTARRGMILATSGLWALTPKKSDYQEVHKGKTKYKQEKVCICQNCGRSWNL